MRKALVVLLVAAGTVGIVGWEGAFGQAEGPRVLSEKEMVDVRFSTCCWANWTTDSYRKCESTYENSCTDAATCVTPQGGCKRTTTPNNAWTPMKYTGDPDDGVEEVGGTFCDVVVDGTCIKVDPVEEPLDCECLYGEEVVRYYFFDHKTCTP